MEKPNIEDFKNELGLLLARYNASITTSKFFCLMDYPAIIFVIGGKEYWSVDEDGFAESVIEQSDIENIVLKH